MAKSEDELSVIMGIQAYGLAWGLIDHLQDRGLLSEEQVRDVMKAAHKKLTLLASVQPEIRPYEMAATFLALDLRTRKPRKKS